MSSGNLILEAAIILILIILNGFFSSAEIAIISAKRSVIDKLVKDGISRAEAVNRMKEDPDRFFASVQVGLTIVSTLASVIGGVAAAEFLKPVFEAVPLGAVQSNAEYISIAIVVIIISYATLVIGELAPKSLALNNAERIAVFSARPLELLARGTAFFVKVLTASTQGVLRLLGVRGPIKRTFVSEEEIKFFIREGRAAGIFEESEAQLLHGVFEFADTTVKEVMVPKHKFSAIDAETQQADVLKIMADAGFSRYPVYRETHEKVIGVLFNKDVFKAMERGEEIRLARLLRPPYFVPESVMISRLLREMQRRKVHMAIVVDEHGEVSGLVTIEDLLEEIVGEIEDEYDVGPGGMVERLKDGAMIIDASASLKDIEAFSIVIDEEDIEYQTLAGFMLAKLQRIPRGGEFVVYNGRRFTVVDVEGNRVVKVKVEPLEARRKAGAAG